MEEFTDVRYARRDGCAVVTIDRPDRMNAFRGRTVDELISAFKTAWADPEVACVVLTGAGERAFCAGGDVKERAETGGYGETEWGTFEIERLHRMIRDVPKPVIAAVNGVA
ncbi:MAG TPA: enoyl-CoA hydratase-related protein, partial [Mycobacteriales bacterium]|nr:enoyl-CoA hydratase-related protein [Mycobacteriales bacterium]